MGRTRRCRPSCSVSGRKGVGAGGRGERAVAAGVPRSGAGVSGGVVPGRDGGREGGASVVPGTEVMERALELEEEAGGEQWGSGRSGRDSVRTERTGVLPVGEGRGEALH